MEEKTGIMPQLRALERGNKVSFSVDKICTVRNCVSILNAQGYTLNKRWKSQMNKEQGMVTVQRIS